MRCTPTAYAKRLAAKIQRYRESIAHQGTCTHAPSRDKNPPRLGCPAGRTPQPPQCAGHPHLLCLFVSFAQPTHMQHLFLHAHMLCFMQAAMQTEMHAFHVVLHLRVCVHGRAPTCTQYHEYLDGLMPAHVQNLLAIPKELAGSALCITAMQEIRLVSTCPQHFCFSLNKCCSAWHVWAAGTGQAQCMKLPWEEYQIQQHGLDWGCCLKRIMQLSQPEPSSCKGSWCRHGLRS